MLRYAHDHSCHNYNPLHNYTPQTNNNANNQHNTQPNHGANHVQELLLSS
jgi:hypothetical protein